MPLAAAAPPVAVTQPAPFQLSLYKPNYVLPLYYTADPYQAVYRGHTPENQRLARTEFKFQLSLKVPVVSDIAGQPLTLYAAYTQRSYWQAYDRSAFFRESNYEPETFLEYALAKPLAAGWSWQALDVGAMHQSNGQGGVLERSWNRIYVGAKLVRNAWSVDVKAWAPLHDASFEQHNPDMAHYLGYGEWVASYHGGGGQTWSLWSRNNLTSGFARGAWQVSWSFPLTRQLRGYAQIFSGYGQSLIEYDHRTTAAGIGVALNDW